MYKLYIGSNNTTKEVEKEKIIEVLNKYFKGYTIIDSIGLWEGIIEKSVIVSIIDEVKDEVVEELKEVLVQDSILVEYIDSKINFK